MTFWIIAIVIVVGCELFRRAVEMEPYVAVWLRGHGAEGFED